MKKAFFFIVIVLSIIGGIAYLARRTETPLQNYEMTSCDMSLWAHVYHGRFSSAQDRLQIINPCVTVCGIITTARREQDGDWHIQLDLDPQFSSLLNQVNREKQQGRLVLEPMCSNPVSQADTREEQVCDDFSQTIFTTDLIGRRVAATGAYVRDMQHGWNEIHPVTSIVSVQ